MTEELIENKIIKELPDKVTRVAGWGWTLPVNGVSRVARELQVHVGFEVGDDFRDEIKAAFRSELESNGFEVSYDASS